MNELVNSLRGATKKARSAQEGLSESAKVEEIRRNNELAETLADEAALFADENLSNAIAEIVEGAEEAAQDGKDSYTKTWTVKREKESTPLPMEELIRYEALRDVAAEHFADMGFTVARYDARDSYVDRVGPSDDGYYPPTFTNHLLQLSLSWELGHS